MKRIAAPVAAACLALLTVSVAAAAPAAPGAIANWHLKIKLSAMSEDERDLGREDDPATAGVNEDRDPDATTEGYLDLAPTLLLQFTPNAAAYLRLQGFVPSGAVVQQESDRPVEAEAFSALRELWLEYGGLTAYPGETLRLGLQRLREPDRIWWDRDIESVRWIFDTTLLQFHIGAGQQFATYRSDKVELPESQQDRAYIFGGFGTQWVPRHFFTVRAAYAFDRRDLPPVGSTRPAESTDPISGVSTYDEPDQRRYAWVGAQLDNAYFDYGRGPGLAYRFELIGLSGRREKVQADGGGVVIGRTVQDVEALAGEAALRLRFPVWPLTLGAAYAFAEGGGDPEKSRTFEQTGLHSNRSRFTGTRSLVNRFNEAYQADLQNLKVVSAFIALPLTNWDFSAVFHRFERDDPRAGVSVDGLDVQPTVDSADLGAGWDLVLTRHFDPRRDLYGPDEDTRSSLRLRAARFKPGAAYGDGVEDLQRVLLEYTQWF